MDAHEIINQAIQKFKPSHVFALYSSGNDSVCATHLTAQHSEFSAAVLVDTGIAIYEAHEHAKKTCAVMSWKLLIYKSPFVYEDLVLRYGFPGAAQHGAMYSQLKERAIRRLIQDHKTHLHDRILLITGVRKAESRRRISTVTSPIVQRGAMVWVAPMWEWSDAERDQYIEDHGLPRNPVKDKIHVSGDCLCGAFAEEGEMELLSIFYPNEYKRIKALQDKAREKFPWDWDENPPAWWNQYQSGQQFLSTDFMPLCWACKR